MSNINFRTLRADEIEVRPSHVKDGKANLLLYIDSRAVVSLLNETVGNLNWQSKFYEANGRVIGEIGIYRHKSERKYYVSSKVQTPYYDDFGISLKMFRQDFIMLRVNYLIAKNILFEDYESEYFCGDCPFEVYINRLAEYEDGSVIE